MLPLWIHTISGGSCTLFNTIATIAQLSWWFMGYHCTIMAKIGNWSSWEPHSLEVVLTKTRKAVVKEWCLPGFTQKTQQNPPDPEKNQRKILATIQYEIHQSHATIQSRSTTWYTKLWKLNEVAWCCTSLELFYWVRTQRNWWAISNSFGSNWGGPQLLVN